MTHALAVSSPPEICIVIVLDLLARITSISAVWFSCNKMPVPVRGSVDLRRSNE